KTTLVKTLAQALGLNFKRIQFTPDLLPSDLIGTEIYNPKTQSFDIKYGPIFANLVLADEINRAPAKVQSALLECMQEQQVTIGNQSFQLSAPFLVFATQNPIEQAGTYLLPEAQLDRFLFKVLVDYPAPEVEKQILRRSQQPHPIQQIFTQAEIIMLQQLVDLVYVDDKIVDYIVRLVQSTRLTSASHRTDPSQQSAVTTNRAKAKPSLRLSLAELIAVGASPRATLAIYHSAKAQALFQQRQFVIPDDVKAVAPACLRHRIARSYTAQAQQISADQIVANLLEMVPTP
ncbi:MAG TPA: AAA family ATPase, partial [Candidatus Babeliales bacterium]|nr:AAA family ATPase [Candidatus Babeliales bacterium]